MLFGCEVLCHFVDACNKGDYIYVMYHSVYRYTDMESEDYSFYQGLVFLLENDVKDLGYELTFSTEVNLTF